jgi:polyphenol oxidase
MFAPYIRNEKVLGYFATVGRAYYFFGTGNTARDELPRLFPHYKFAFLKQMHGRTVIEADPIKLYEADGHYTRTPKLALVSQSADCLPLLFGSDEQVCAIHAGWRGMAANIIGAALAVIQKPDFVAIGPHLMRESFEVGRDVADLLLKAAATPDPTLISPAATPDKAYFDLLKLARNQLAAHGLRAEECCFDTKTNPLFHSYRRGRQSLARQYSFVVLRE